MDEVEDLFVIFLKSRPAEKLNKIFTGFDVFMAMNDDEIEQLKEYAWAIITRHISFNKIIERAKADDEINTD